MADNLDKFYIPNSADTPTQGADSLDKFFVPGQDEANEQRLMNEAGAALEAEATGTSGKSDVIGSFAAGVNRTFGPIARSVVGAGAFLAGSDTARKELDRQASVESQQFESAVETNPIAAQTGRIGSLFAAGAVVPGGVTGGIAKRVATGALSGGLFGGLSEEGSLGDRAVNATVGAAGAGLLTGLFAGGRAGIKAIRGAAGQKAVTELSEDIATVGANKAAKGLAAGQRQGIRLTPGEATQSPLILGKESKAVQTADTQRTLQKFLDTRSAKLTTQLSKQIDDVVAEGEDVAIAARDQLFDKISTKVIPTDTVNKLMDDPIINQNLVRILDDPEFAVQDTAVNSIGRLNLVRRSINEKIQKLVTKEEGIPQTRIRNLEIASKKIEKVLSDADPDFVKANAIAQRLSIKDSLLKNVQTTDDGLVDINSFFTKKLNTPDKVTKFIRNIKTAGGDTQQARDFVTIMQKIKGSKLEGLVKEQVTGASRLAISSGPAGIASQFVSRKLQAPVARKFLELAINSNETKTVRGLAQLAKKAKTNKELEALVDGVVAAVAKTSGPAVAPNL